MTFNYDVKRVNISAQPNNSCNSYESCKSVFRDPALQAEGYPTGATGVNDYVTSLKSSLGTEWAYMVFFVKYPVHKVSSNGYAINSRYICMQYSNGGWGTSNRDKVFAHESGHSFWAQDEYGSCTCGTNSGQCSVPNKNCVNCTGDHEDCIMDKSTFNICQWTRGQIGWQYCTSGYETSLPSTGSNIVSVLESDGSLFCGSDGYTFKLDSSGTIVETNNLSGRGNHEVRLAMSTDGNTLYLGTDGYALALNTSNLSTIWQTSLPSTGSNIVSVLFDGTYLYAGSDGYVFKLDTNGKILKTNSLSGRGNHEVRLALSADGNTLYVGTDGYALVLTTSDLSTSWQTSLPNTGSNIVSLLLNRESLYAGSDGYLYELDPSDGTIRNVNTLPSRGYHEVKMVLSDDSTILYLETDGYALGLKASDLSTVWQTSLPSTGSNIVSVLISNNYLFAGSNGYLYGLDMNLGTIVYANDLPSRGNHEVRLAAANNTLFLGTDGYALSVDINSGAPSCSY